MLMQVHTLTSNILMKRQPKILLIINCQTLAIPFILFVLTQVQYVEWLFKNIRTEIMLHLFFSDMVWRKSCIRLKLAVNGSDFYPTILQNSKAFSYKKIDTASYFEYVNAHKSESIPQICICEENDKMTDRPTNSWMSYCLIFSTSKTGATGIILLSDNKLYLGVNTNSSISWKQIV